MARRGPKGQRDDPEWQKRFRKIPATFQLTGETVLLIEAYAKHLGIAKQVAVDQLIMAAIKEKIKQKEIEL